MEQLALACRQPYGCIQGLMRQQPARGTLPPALLTGPARPSVWQLGLVLISRDRSQETDADSQVCVASFVVPTECTHQADSGKVG